MDDQIKEPVARPEPAPPQDVKAQPFNSYLKALMESNKARGSSLATIAGVPQSCVSRWLKGNLMPTISQAKALDESFGSNLLEIYHDQLRSDRKPATLKPETISIGSLEEEAEAAADFLKGFGNSRSGNRPASVETPDAIDKDAALGILRLVLECLKLIIQSRSINNIE